MANNNQNTQQPKKVPITISGYPQAVQDMMRAKHPDYDQVMNQGMQGAPNGQIPAVAPQPASMNFFQPNGGAVGKYEAPAVQPQPVQPVQPVQTGEAPVTDFTNMPQQPTGWNEDGTPSYDSLSSALSGAAVSQKQEAPAFQSDPSKKDGGFFGWLGSLIPKKRPGMREGETPEEYDRRRTRNMEMMTTLADAIRHMGNIVNTSKGAPLQQFNDPTAMMEQGYQNRKAQRQKQAALDADAAYKQANLSLKERAAEAQRAYQQATLGYKQADLQRKVNKDKTDLAKWQAKFEFDAAKDDRDFKYKQIRDKVKDGQWQAGYGIKVANLNLSRARFAHTLAKDAKGGDGYGYATPYGFLSSKKQISPQQEEQMWNFMVRNGQITKKKLAEYQDAAKGDGSSLGLYGTDKGSTSRSRKIIQECIAYGLMDATRKGDNFRKFCTTQLGMGESRLYNTPQNPSTWKRDSVKQGKTGKWSI